MGQAKDRGSREVRVAQSVERRRAEDAVRRELEALRLAAMTPEERKRRRQSQMALAALVGLTGGLK